MGIGRRDEIWQGRELGQDVLGGRSTSQKKIFLKKLQESGTQATSQ
jgi:hypothetical protein